MINGDIKSKRKMTAAYLRGFYTSTFFPDRLNGPFAADAIISNPPAFAHIHVAEALGIPLHMSFSAFVALPLVPSARCLVVLLFTCDVTCTILLSLTHIYPPSLPTSPAGVLQLCRSTL